MEWKNELLFVLLFAAVLFLSNLWGYDLWAPDEPKFAEISREMLETGNWIVPHDNGWIYTDKPPLLFWLISTFSLLTGRISSFQARLPSALAGIGAVAATYIFALKCFGRKTALLSSLILSTSFLFFDKARTAQTDMLLTFFILISFLFFYLSRGEPIHRRRYLIFFYLSLALGTLAKGPLGFIIPIGVILIFLASVGEMKRVREIFLTDGLSLFLLIVGGWVVAATIAGKGEYSVFAALDRHLIERFSEGIHHRQPLYYFLKTFPLDFLPWSLFLPAALALLFSKLRSVERKEAAFLLCWVFFVFVLFSFSREKRNLYILPLFPAASIMVGYLFSVILSEGEESIPSRLASAFNYFLSGLLIICGSFIPVAAWIKAREYLFPASLLGAVIIVSSFIIFWFTWKEGWLKGLNFSYFPLFFGTGLLLPMISLRFYPDFFFPVLLMGVLLIIGSLFITLELRKGFGFRTLIAILLTISSFYLAAVFFAYPVLDDYKSAKSFSIRIASTVRDHLKQGERLPIYKRYRSAYVFYSRIYLDLILSEEAFKNVMSSSERKFCLIEQNDLNEISEKLELPLYRIHSEGVGHRSMILVSNQP
ncbi:MAG: glycosyltransferase family 39 protein [Acidobacteriota bacterium]